MLVCYCLILYIFFCHSNVIYIEVALNILGESLEIILLHLWKWIFLKQTVFVCCSPSASEYLQDHMQKKNATTWSHAMVVSIIEFHENLACECISWQTLTCKAFCCFSLGSLFFIPFCVTMGGVVSHIFPKDLTQFCHGLLHCACFFSFGFENCLIYRAVAKAPKSLVWNMGDKSCK